MPALVTSRYVNAYGKAQNPTQLELTTDAGTTDGYIVRYDTSGKAMWSARILSSGATTTIYGVITDNDGNVIVAGQSGSGVTTFLFNADGTYGPRTFGNSGVNDSFVAKYHSSGRALWIARVGGAGTDIGYGISVDSTGNIYFAGAQGGGGAVTAYNANGSAFGTVIPQRSGNETAIVKYNPNGTVLFVAQVGGSTASSFDVGFAIVVDKLTGDFYVGGRAQGVPTTAYNSDLTAFATTITPSGTGGDAYIVKYNSTGFVQWFTRVATTTEDFIQSLDVDSSGNVYGFGRSAGAGGNTIAYNADGTAFATQPTALGSRDSFLVKYDSTGLVQWIVLIGGANTEDAYAVVVDKSNSANVYTTHLRGGSGNGDTYLRKHSTSTGATVWESRVDSDAADALWGLTTDTNGDIYLGYTGGNLSSTRVRNAAGTAIFTVTNTGGSTDAYLIKYNTSGTPQWVRRLGSAANETSQAVTVGNSNDLYIVGQFVARPAALYGQTLSIFSTIPNAGGTDGFIVNYNSNGSPQWTGRIASTGDDIAYGTTADSQGNVYVTGQSGSGVVITAYNADGSAFGTTFTSVGNDVFLVKYNPYGTVQWITYISSTGTDIGYAAATDSSGNVYITGSGGAGTVTAYSVGAVAFSPALANAGSGDAFVVKYNSSGTVQWNARISSTGVDIGFGIATDSSGSVYVTGQGGNGVAISVRNSDDTVFGTLANLSGIDAFVAKYNTNGTVQWIARIGNPSNLTQDYGYCIATDQSANVYIGLAGGGAPITAYQGGNGTGLAFATIAQTGGGDAIIVKYDTNGVGQWITRIAAGNPDQAYGIKTDLAGNVYVVGLHSGSAISSAATIFNSDGTSILPLLAYSGGSGEAFIVKYNSSGFAQWGARIAASTTVDVAYGVDVDRVGNVYVAGTFGSANNGDTTITNADGTTYATFRESAAVAKFNTNGYCQWAVPLRAVNTTGTLFPGSAIARSVSCDYFGNITVVGSSVSGRSIYVYGSDQTIYKLLYIPRGATTGATTDGVVIKYSAMGIPQWGSIISGTGSNSENIFGVATDSSGNIYATGQYGTGTMTLVNGDGTLFTSTLAISGALDSILLKYNSAGTIQWRARVFGSGSEQALGIGVDSSSNVYVIGQGGSGTSTTFVNSDDTTTLAVLATTAGLQDGFIAKYNTSGTGQWRFRVSSTTVDAGRSVAIDSSGNIYITGQAGAAGFYNANDTLAASITDTGSGDAYVAKYDTNGTFQWVAKLGSASTNFDIGYGIAVDSSGNVYVTGRWGGSTLTITNSDGTVTLPTMTSLSVTDIDIFVAKFDTNGFGQWRTRIASTNIGNLDEGRSIAVDTSGNVFVAGQYYGNPSCIFYQADGTTAFTTIGSTGNYGGFLIKYDTNGNPQWVGRVDSTGGATTTDISQAVATDSSGNSYVTLTGGVGVTSFAFNGDASLFGSMMTGPTNAATAMLVKYNSSGAVQWLSSMGTHGTNDARGLAVDSSGNIIMSGAFTATVFLPESSNA